MKTENQVQQDILSITQRIQEEFPELSIFIKEVPVNISENEGKGPGLKNMIEYFNSLEELINRYSKTHVSFSENTGKQNITGYPQYPPADDIYNQGNKEINLDPDNLSKTKSLNEEEGLMNELDFADDMSGSDLDVPGSELDDLQESSGSEDEENNYYSIGGDLHHDLEENKG